MQSKNVIIYTRISKTNNPDENGLVKQKVSPEMQIDKCKAFCSSKDWNVIKVICDEDTSGGNLDRPGFQEAKGMLEMGLANGIVSYRLDRITRNLEDLVGLINTFKKNNAFFATVEDGLDSSSSAGESVIKLIGLIAEMERDFIRSRIKDSSHHAIAAGQYMGTSYPYWCKKIGKGRYSKFELIEENVKIAKKIIDLYLGEDGLNAHSALEIARYLNKEGVPHPKDLRSGKNSGRHWGRGQVLSSLKNPALIGKMNFTADGGGQMISAPFPCIISEHTYQLIQHKLKQERKGTGQAVYTKYPLSGLLTCAHCGSPLSGHSLQKGKNVKNGRVRWYRCNSQHVNSAHGMEKVKCDLGGVPADEIELHVSNMVTSIMPDENELLKILSLVARKSESGLIKTKRKEVSMKDELAKIDKKIENLNQKYVDTDLEVESYNEMLRKLREKKLGMESELGKNKEINIVLDALKKEGAESVNLYLVRQILSNIHALPTPEAKRFMKKVFSVLQVETLEKGVFKLTAEIDKNLEIENQQLEKALDISKLDAALAN